MVVSSKLENLKVMLTPAVQAAGMELWGLEFFPQGKHSVLRLFIDSENGVTIDDCERVSHQVSAVLDVEDPVSGEYHLEVSSPGMDRPLFGAEQLGRYIHCEIKVRLKMAVDGKRNFVGKLLAVSEDRCSFEVDGAPLVVATSQIDKANLVPNFE
ncbi:Protein of unknown function DUF150 [gamma proteobacterium HdN1]|nr:Protein of unknown function DUF150 [gamma proteobacterium HdN1]